MNAQIGRERAVFFYAGNGAGKGGIAWSMELFLYKDIRIAASAARLNEAEEEAGGGEFDLFVMSHAAAEGEVDLIDEVRGESGVLAEITRLSAAMGCTVVVGLYLCYGGAKKLSAAVAHCGELADITDSCSVSEPYIPGGTIRLYRTDKGLIGVLVGGDARVRFIMEKLAGLVKMVVCLEPDYRAENETRVRKLSAELGLPLLYVSPARIFLAA